jgi:hypothetical protein
MEKMLVRLGRLIYERRTEQVGSRVSSTPIHPQKQHEPPVERSRSLVWVGTTATQILEPGRGYVDSMSFRQLV